MGQKSIHFTLDFEVDLGTAAVEQTHVAAQRADRLLELAERHGLPLTVFCEGAILAKQFDIVRPLIDYGAEIELHAYDHSAAYAGSAARVSNLRDGIAAYGDRFGRMPFIYRAPDGVIGRPELEVLASHGIGFDSSVYPAWFPGRFDFRHCPRSPFRVAGLPLIELPMATLGTIRLPVGLSYFQLLGGRAFKALAATFDVPDAIVFDFHMHDLIRGDWWKRPGVALPVRLGYWRAQRMDDPAEALGEVADWFVTRGHRPEPLSALAERVRDTALPEVSVR